MWRVPRGICIYLALLVAGLSGLILLLAIHATGHVNLVTAIGLLSFILIIVSFLQLSREWVSPRDWLQVFSLAFLIGTSILKTAFAPTWNDIGQLAAIIAIRTTLNYFLLRSINND